MHTKSGSGWDDALLRLFGRCSPLVTPTSNLRLLLLSLTTLKRGDAWFTNLCLSMTIDYIRHVSYLGGEIIGDFNPLEISDLQLSGFNPASPKRSRLLHR